VVVSVATGSPHGFAAGTVPGVQSQEWSTAARNARSGGLCHVRTKDPQDADGVPVLSEALRGCWRVTETSSGRGFLEVAFLANLTRDLHPPQPGCFEAYELVPSGDMVAYALSINLVTPDLYIDLDSGDMLIAGMVELDPAARSAFDPHELMIEVSCYGRPGLPSEVRYVLSPWTGTQRTNPERLA